MLVSVLFLFACSRSAGSGAPSDDGSAGMGGAAAGGSGAGGEGMGSSGASSGGGGPLDFTAPVVIFEQLPKAPAGNVAAVDVDEAAGYVNFANRWSGQVERVPIGGGAVETLGPHGDVGSDYRITSDAEHVYWVAAERQEDLSLAYSIDKYSKEYGALTSFPLDREFPYGDLLNREDKLYVTAVMCNPMGRLNKDGTEVELIDNPLALQPGGSTDVAVDDSAFYCTNLQQIFRWPHDADEPEVIYQPEGRYVYGVAVRGDYLYFLDADTAVAPYVAIQRMPKGGGEPEELPVSGRYGATTAALLLDATELVLYWIGPRTIMSTPFWVYRLGSDEMTQFVSGRTNPISLKQSSDYLFWAEENTVVQMRKPSVP